VIDALSRWILSGISSEINLNYFTWLKKFYKTINHMSEKHGFVHTVKVVKQLQLHLTRYLSGNPLLTNQLRIGITKKGLPRLL